MENKVSTEKTGTIEINGKSYAACKLKMVEIYRGKDPDWKGWHNLILDLGGAEFDKCIAGPIDPQTSLELLASIKSIGKEVE